MFLGATAGMRLLSRKNRSQVEDVFAAVRQALGQSPVDFRGAELLTGQDEGAFGWITINYVLGLLVKYSFSGEWIRPLEETLVGALDMGGASTQITFVPGGPILDKTTQATFRLYGADHTVYTHSYLCFGRDQALSRLLAELVQASPGLLVRHPCYHSGYRGTLALAPLYESPCVPAAPPGLSQNLTVEGTGNPGACVEALRKLFNFSSCDGREDCAFAGVYQPPVQGQFYVSPLSLPSGPSFLLEAKGPNPRRPWGAWDPGWGGLGLSLARPGPRPQGHVAPPTRARGPSPQAFSSFYYTFHFLNLTSKPSLSEANATVWQFCRRPWKLVEESAPADQDPWLRDYCASGLYFLTLLVEGYGFSEETWGGIEFRQQAGGTDIGWTLGYMLNLTNLIPAEVPAQRRAQSFGVWTAGVVFLVLTLAATLGAVGVQLFWIQD